MAINFYSWAAKVGINQFATWKPFLNVEDSFNFKMSLDGEDVFFIDLQYNFSKTSLGNAFI